MTDYMIKLAPIIVVFGLWNDIFHSKNCCYLLLPINKYIPNKSFCSCSTIHRLPSRTGRPDYAEKILRSSEKKKKDIFGEMKPRLTCTNMMGREKYTQGSKQLPIWSIKLYLLNMGEPMVWHGHVWLLVELGHYCVLMVWLLTEVTDWMLKCTGLYSLHIFSQMLNNWLDGASYCKMIMTHGLLQKQTKNFSKHVFFFSFGR